MKEKTSQTRINDILLGPLERPALHWLASRMPGWVTPNILTGVGLLAAILICVSYWLTNFDKLFLWLASFGFILNWFGDSLDGTLARYRKIERPKFGYFIDHSLDTLTQLFIGLGIGLSPYVSFKFALFALIGYFMVSIHIYITNYVSGIFKLSYGKLGPTEFRVIVILVNTLVYFVDTHKLKFPMGMTTFFDIMAFLCGSALIVIFIVSTFKHAIELSGVD